MLAVEVADFAAVVLVDLVVLVVRGLVVLLRVDVVLVVVLVVRVAIVGLIFANCLAQSYRVLVTHSINLKQNHQTK